MSSDGPILRPFQERAFQSFQLMCTKLAAVRAAGREPETADKVLIWDAAPGAGKTLTWLHCANYAFRLGLIDSAVCYVPRVNLAEQTECAWNELCSLYSAPAMGAIEHRDNTLPFIPPGSSAFGFVSTFQSLCAQPEAHLDFFKSRRVLLIGDEAQMLGDEVDGDGTRSGEYFKALGELAFAGILMTGTPLRADNAPLVFAKYTEPDQNGVRYLLPNVQVTYLEGVRDGFLRPVEVQLHDGIANFILPSGDDKVEAVSEMERRLSDVMRDSRYYARLVRSTIDSIAERQQVLPSYCGLIGCVDQDHAREVLAFVEKHYPSVRALLAISDDKDAQANLRDFKNGDFDLLISVGMVFIGYDHKEITVVCCMNAIRYAGWIRQFLARGMRCISTGNAEIDQAQYLSVIAPDDPQMGQIIDDLRRESRLGLQERAARETKATTDGAGSANLPSAILADIKPTGIRGVGMDPVNDVTAEEYHLIESKRREHGLLNAQVTNLKGFLKAFNADIKPTTMPAAGPSRLVPMTAMEKEKLLRRQLRKLTNRADHLLGDRWGYTRHVINRKMGKPRTVQELQAAIQWVKGEWLPKCASIKAEGSNAQAS